MASMFVPLRRAQTWRLHGVSKYRANLVTNRTNLILGDIVFISIIFHISDSWLNFFLNGYHFYFWSRDSENLQHFYEPCIGLTFKLLVRPRIGLFSHKDWNYLVKKIGKLIHAQFVSFYFWFLFCCLFFLSLSQAHRTGRKLGSSGVRSPDYPLHMCSIGKTQANQILWQYPTMHCGWMWHVHGTGIPRANHVLKSATSGFDWWPQTVTAGRPGQLGNNTRLECVYVWEAFWASEDAGASVQNGKRRTCPQYIII